MVFPLIFSSFLRPRSRYRSSFPFFHFCVFFFVFAVDSAAVNLEYSNCAPQTCNGITIKYPFFLPSQSSNGCGYPGFNLSCTNRNTTLLFQAPTFNLAVLSIDYEGQTFNAKIADDSITGIHPCSYPNQTINPPSPLSITVLDKIQTLYYNCTTTPTGDGGGGYVGGSTYDINAQLVPSCSITTSGMYSYAFFDQDSPASRGVQGMSCQTTVSFPVLTKFGAGDLTASLSSGFILGWSKLDSMPNCVDCGVSGGRCGMNTTTGSFLCFCPDDTYPGTCNGGAPRGKKVKVIAGVSAGSSALIIGMLLTVCYFLYYRKRKRPSPSTVYFTRSLSSSKTSSLTDMESRSFHQRCGDRVTVFTYRELQEATDDFNSSNEIGDGGFGAVYLGKLHDGRKVAVKKLYENNFRRVEQFMNEIGILSCIEHPNLVKLYGCTSRHSRELLLVYEYIDNGTVSDHIHGSRAKGHLKWKVRLTIAIETAEALAYLHRLDPPIIHRDVKTSNILLDKAYHVKVADFGLSRLFPVDVTHVSTAPQGTPGYVDPEYHKCYQLTDKSDVYSFGVVLAELISSLPAVDIRRHRHEINLANFAVNKIQNHELHAFVDSSIGFETDQWVKKTVTAVAEMAFRCLSTERDVRPTMDEVAESLRKIELEGIKQGKTTVANSLRKIESEGPKQGKTTVAMRKIESEGPKQGKTAVANSLRRIESEGPKQGKTAVANSLRKMEPRQSEPEEAAVGPESQKEAGVVPKAAGPLSPNSVTDKWPSHYSTPNNSG